MHITDESVIVSDTEKKQANYFRKEQKVYKYAREFFKENKWYFDPCGDSISDEIRRPDLDVKDAGRIPPVYGDITVDMLSVQFVEKVLKLVKSGNYTLQLEE